MNHPANEELDLIVRLMADDRLHAHRSEDRRIFITGVNIIATTAVLVALILGSSRNARLVLSFWLLLIGVYGLFACLKLAERDAFHTLRARSLRALLIELAPQTGVERILHAAEQTHRVSQPRLARLRLNDLLVSLHAGMVALGCISALLVGVSGR
jgi:Zn-dependent protease